MVEQLESIQKAIAEGKTELARNLLRVLIEQHPQSSEVWYWAAKVAVNPTQKRAFLEKAVDLDPLNHLAANELYTVDNPQVIVDTPKIQLTQAKVSQQSAIKYASFGKRVGAFLTDFMIIFALFVPLAGIALATNQQTTLNDSIRLITLLTTLSLIVQAIYFAYFLTRRDGQTVGKQIFGIRVVKRDGTALSLWEAILRTVIGYAFSNLVLGTGHLWMLSDKQSQTWHDMVADTIVVEA